MNAPSRIALLPALALFACNPGGTVEGRVVDGFTGEARSDLRVLARSDDATDLTCKVREATTDASGAFKLENTCAGATYTLAAADETLMLDGDVGLAGGEQRAGVEFKAWRAPTGAGVYRLTKDELKPLRTFSDISTETVKGTDVKVRYPQLKPTKVISLEKGDHLVFAGKETVDTLKIHPLVADDAVRGFEGDITIDNHVYIGVRFTSDEAYELVDAQLDAGKVRNVSSGDHVVRYIAQDALPEGRYAILGDSDKRTYVLDFGTVDAPATASK
jgi:hypothetical protein